MMYKTGDVARIRTIEDLRSEFVPLYTIPCGWCNEMNQYAGEEVIIKKVHNRLDGTFHYDIEEDGGTFAWHESMFEIEKEQPPVVENLITYDDLFEGN